MDIARVRQDFEARYYQWALQEFRQEIESGYPLLRGVGDESARKLLALMQGLPKAEQVQFSAALVKRFHKEAAQGLGEGDDQGSRGLIKTFLDASGPSSPEQRQTDKLKELGEWIPVRRRRLARLVRSALDPVCGTLVGTYRASGWNYRISHGDFLIYTGLDLGGRSYQLTYWHQVATRDFLRIEEALTRLSETGNSDRFLRLLSSGISDPRIREQISYLSALGVSGQTVWDDVSEDDAPQVAEALAKLCARFIEAAPSLLPAS